MGTRLLIAELQRRRVFRALVAYGVAAFAVLQIIEPIMHGLHWPDAVLSYVVVALALGFPLVVGLAWVFDITDGRVERTGPTGGGLRGARLTLVLLGIGILAAAPGTAWYLYARSRKPPAAAGTPSIAVLPFVNLSSDKEQEYFSDGIAEEILNALAQVQGLRVIGRTSSFSMKGKAEDLRTIGEKLNAATLLEGSVRKAGVRVRITAQLIEAAGGSHLWSQEFDRDLTDVFAVQEEIAKAVVAALRLKLLPAAGDEQRTASVEAHDQYLLGRHLLERGSPDSYGRAVKVLEKAVALDSGYAPAWAALAVAHFWASDQAPGENDPAQGWPRASVAAEKAIALAPNLADGFAARSLLRTALQRDWAGARSDLDRAAELSPGSPEILVQSGWLMSTLGQIPQAIAVMHKATAVDPLSTEAWVRLSGYHLGAGQFDLAEAGARRALEISPEQGRAARNLGFALLLNGRIEEARQAFLGSSLELYHLVGVALVEHALHHPDLSQRALDELLAKSYVLSASYQVAQTYAWRGEPDKVFEWLEKAYQFHDAGLTYLKYDPFMRDVRRDARFVALLRKMNLPPD